MDESIRDKSWDNNRVNFNRSLAVVVGIDRYKDDRIRNLSTAVGDAKAIATLLEKTYNYKQSDAQPTVIRLFDEQATLVELRNLLFKTLPEQQLMESDRLIVYLAGHGLSRPSQEGPAGYLLPHDANETVPDSFLSMQEIYQALHQLKCHHLLVILDCCFAGMFQWAGSRKATALDIILREHYDHFIRHPAWRVITSSAHDQEALDVACLSTDQRQVRSHQRHSPFAQALLEGLQPGDDPQRLKADFSQDGVVTVPELFAYVQTRVKQLSNQQQASGYFSFPGRQAYDQGEFIFTAPEFSVDKLNAAPDLDEESNPYRGLEPFDERHSDLFFGREALVEQLTQRVSQANQALTVVTGISGCGKSSLVKAGLLPALRQSIGPMQWRLLSPMRPGDRPLLALARTLLPLVNPQLLQQLTQVSFLDDALRQVLQLQQNEKISDTEGRLKQERGDLEDRGVEKRDRPLLTQHSPLQQVARAWEKTTPENKLLLIVDYFEQLKSYGSSEEQKQLENLQQQVSIEQQATLEKLQQPEYLSELIKIWSQHNQNTKLLLFIDQFEELLTMNREQSSKQQKVKSTEQAVSSEAERFLQQLSRAVSVSCGYATPPCHIVVTLRTDFKPRFEHSPLREFWQAAQFPVQALSLEELRQVIEGPALKRAIYFEPPDLVSQLVSDVAQMPGALPLLSFALSELYIQLHQRWKHNPKSDRALHREDYDQLAGVEGALSRRATEEYEKLLEQREPSAGKAYQATMRRVMLRMVTVEGGAVARRRVRQSELEYTDPQENERVQFVVDRLVDARLLVRGQESRISGVGPMAIAQETVESYVEPAHDFLVRGWELLSEWKREQEEDIILQRKLTPEAETWVNLKSQETPVPAIGPTTLGNHLDNFLYPLEETVGHFFKGLFAKPIKWLRSRPSPTSSSEKTIQPSATQHLWNNNAYLDVVNQTLHSENNWLNRVETEFVQNSVLQKRRNTSRNWRIARGVILALLVLVGWAFLEQRRTVIGQINTLRESAESDLRSNTLTLDALVNSLQATELTHHWLLRILPADLTHKTLNQEVAATVRQAYYNVREAGRWQIPQNSEIQDVFVDPTGQPFLAITKSGNTLLCIWSLTGEVCDNKVYTGSENDAPKKVQFSPDGRRVVIASLAGEGIVVVRLWDWQNNQSQELPYRFQSELLSFSFNPKGGELAIADLGTPYLWSLENNQLYSLLNNPANVKGIQFTPDGHLLLAIASSSENTDGSTTQALDLWSYDRVSYQKLGTMNPPFEVDSVTIHPNGERVVVVYGGARRFGPESLLWTVGANTDRNQWEKIEETIHRFSDDDQQLATADAQGVISLRNWSGLQTQTLSGHRGLLQGMSFSHDEAGQFLLTAGSDKALRLWRMQEQPLEQLPGDQNFQFIDSGWQELDQQDCSSLSGSHSFGVYIGGPTGDTSRSTVDLWDCSSNTLAATVQVGQIYIKERTAMTLSPSASLMAIAQSDGKVGLWDFQGVQLAEFTTEIAEVEHLFFNTAGDVLKIEGQTNGQSSTELWEIGNPAMLFAQGCSRVLPYLGQIRGSDRTVCENFRQNNIGGN